jgi:hypothetical protein
MVAKLGRLIAAEHSGQAFRSPQCPDGGRGWAALIKKARRAYGSAPGALTTAKSTTGAAAEASTSRTRMDMSLS